jgi:hypothetical protein
MYNLALLRLVDASAVQIMRLVAYLFNISSSANLTLTSWGLGVCCAACLQVGLTKVFLKAHQSALLNKLHMVALGRAATKIQAAWRGHAARRQYAVKRAAITTIQAGVRGMIGRRRAVEVRRDKAATRIQAAWRRACARASYLQLQQAALVLQCAARGAAARVLYRHMCEQQRQAAATAIQAAWRGRRVRQRCAAELAGALALQSAWRGLLVRQQVAAQLQQHRAAARIQRQWRRHWRACNGGFRCDAAAEAAARVIQGIWREREQHNSKVRQLQAAVRQYTALHHAAVTLQAAWQGRAARKVLTAHQDSQRRCRFKQQMAMFEQQMASAAAGAPGVASLSRAGSRGVSDSDACSSSHPPHTMPAPQRASYGVPYAGLAPRSPSPATSEGGAGASAGGAASSSLAAPRPPATTTSSFRLRPLPPPPAAAYGVSYAGINGDINPIAPGEHTWAEQPPKPRNFKLFAPPPPAAYGLSYQGSRSSGGGSAPNDHMRARLLEPAPAAAYGVTFSGLQHLGAASSSNAAGSSNSSSRPNSAMQRSASQGAGRQPGPARLLNGLRRLGSGAGSSSKGGVWAGDSEGEEAPLLDVVKADDSSLLSPEDRLFARLGSLVEDKGRVSSAVGSWRDKLRTR